MTPTGPDITMLAGPSAAPQKVPRPSRRATLATNPSLRRLVICLAGVLVVAVMTGPAGSNTAPTSGFTGSLGFPRLFWFLGLAVVLFVVVSAWRGSSAAARAAANRL